jgi:hypothetical protein
MAISDTTIQDIKKGADIRFNRFCPLYFWSDPKVFVIYLWLFCKGVADAYHN